MKLQYFNGGLGNQLFQYIFYRYFQLHVAEEIWLDRKMAAAIPNAVYLVFSDDIPWCKDNFKALGLDQAGDRVVFVTGNQGENSFRDMQLLSMCEGMILANSAFSYFAALYNSRPDKAVINPLRYRRI